MSKVAVVTGAAKGLGKFLAEKLAGEGYTLAIHYKTSKAEAEKVFQNIEKASPGSITVSADLTSEKEVSEMFERVEKELGTVDLLINNVGNFLFKPFGKTSNSEIKDLLESNILSTLYSSRAVLPGMRTKKSGYIINIGAVGAERLIIRENSTPYFLGKTGIYVLTKTMAWEEAKNGVHINMVSPASLVSDIFDEKDFPMGRSAKYEDVWSAVAFLTSEAAYYINGANIEVSGAFVPGMAKDE